MVNIINEVKLSAGYANFVLKRKTLQFTHQKVKVVTPRVQLKAIELLNSGEILSKYDLAKKAYCDHRTAQRILSKLTGIYVCSWRRHVNKHIPVYKKGNKYDKSKPKIKTHAEVCKKYDDDPEHKINKLMRHRIRKIIKRIGI